MASQGVNFEVVSVPVNHLCARLYRKTFKLGNPYEVALNGGFGDSSAVNGCITMKHAKGSFLDTNASFDV
jgi:hypothetical protein